MAITALLAGVVISLVFLTEGIKADHIAVGLWFVSIPWSVGYFEFVNSRLRRSRGIQTSGSPGLPLAVVGLVIGWVLILMGPLALVLAYLGWRRIRNAGVPYGPGSAAAAVALVVGSLGTLYLGLVLADVA